MMATLRTCWIRAMRIKYLITRPRRCMALNLIYKWWKNCNNNLRSRGKAAYSAVPAQIYQLYFHSRCRVSRFQISWTKIKMKKGQVNQILSTKVSCSSTSNLSRASRQWWLQGKQNLIWASGWNLTKRKGAHKENLIAWPRALCFKKWIN